MKSLIIQICRGALFDGLRIADYEEYKNHVGQHDVIYIDFSELPRECSNYHEYISRIQEYAATALELKTKEEIYAAMVVYGLLTYDRGMVFIPNKELMQYIKKY